MKKAEKKQYREPKMRIAIIRTCSIIASSPEQYEPEPEQYETFSFGGDNDEYGSPYEAE